MALSRPSAARWLIETGERSRPAAFGWVVETQGGGGSPDVVATGGTGTGIGSGSGGDATGAAGGDATAAGGTGTGVGSGSGGDATGTGSGTFVSSEIWSDGLLQVGVSAACTWYPGSIGADPTSALVHSSLVTSASGQLTLSGLPSGAGEMLAKLPDGKFYYEPGIVT